MKTSKQKLQKQLNDIQKQLDNFGVDKETLSDLLRPKIHELIDVKFGIRPIELIHKDKIKIPLVTKLEVGKWYKLIENYTNTLRKGDVFTFDKYQDRSKTYAVVGHKIYLSYPKHSSGDNYLAPPSKNLIPATEKEVKTALIKEAIKRGLNKSNIIINVYNGKNCNSNTFSYFKYSGVKLLAYDSKGLYTQVFKNGVWAEIVEKAKPKINGYEMEICGNTVSFGCKKFRQDDIIDFHRMCNKIGATSFKIWGNSPSDYYEVTLKELTDVLVYLNK